VAGSENRWAMTSVFVPRGKGNLASFVSVDSDATSDTFGQMRVLEVTDATAPGPGQVANEMQNDDEVVDKLQEFRVPGAPPPIFGNILTLPIDDGFVHIEPVYAARSASSSFPILQFVIVYYNKDVGIGTTLPAALRDAFDDGGGTTTPPPDTPPDDEPDTPPDQGNGGGGNQSLAQQIDSLLTRAEAKFEEADAARRSGDFVKWATLMDEGRDLIAKALDKRDQQKARQDPSAP